MFVVVNTNAKTHHPTTGELFGGQLCYSNGYQTANMSEASIYWSKKGADTLAKRLNGGHLDKVFKQHHGLNFANTIIDGQYVVREYQLSEVTS